MSTAINHSKFPDNTVARGVPAPASKISRALGGASAGAAVGFTLGLFCGPIGVVAGAVVGATVGLLSYLGVAKASVWSAKRTAILDEAIGISGGDIGAPPESCRLPVAREVTIDGFMASFDVPRGESLRPLRHAA